MCAYVELVIRVPLYQSVCVHPYHQSTRVILCLGMVFRLLVAVCSHVFGCVLV